MKRLLLATGALVASVIFSAAPAHADDAMNHRVLTIEVIGTTKAHPTAFAALTVRLPYETKFTCEEAQERLDADAILQIVKSRLTKKHITPRGVASSCAVAGAII